MTDVAGSIFQVSYVSFIYFSVGNGLEDQFGLEDQNAGDQIRMRVSENGNAG